MGERRAGHPRVRGEHPRRGRDTAESGKHDPGPLKNRARPAGHCRAGLRHPRDAQPRGRKRGGAGAEKGDRLSRGIGRRAAAGIVRRRYAHWHHPHEPAEQRDQVHQNRHGYAERGRGLSAGGYLRACGCCAGHGNGHGAGGAGEGVPPAPARGRGGKHGPWHRDVAGAAGTDGQHAGGGERKRQRQRVLLPAAAEGSQPGRGRGVSGAQEHARQTAAGPADTLGAEGGRAGGGRQRHESEGGRRADEALRDHT